MSQVKRLWRFIHRLKSLTNDEFDTLIFQVLEKATNFERVSRSNKRNNIGFDFQAARIVSPTKRTKAYFYLIRSGVITQDYVRRMVSYIKEKKTTEEKEYYIVTDDVVREDAQFMANDLGIWIWDMYMLESLVKDELREVFFNTDSSFLGKKGKEVDYSCELRELRPGKENWVRFQYLSCEVFSYLFSPPLSLPRFEHGDAENRNRRDMIYENSTNHSFWDSIRTQYHGYYIVVDAKNYSKPIPKQSVIDVAHYLKPYGCGMFAILISRNGAANSAKHAQKEQWIGNGKMILILDDNDLLDMIKLKKLNQKPEEILRIKLANLRMSL